MPVSLAALVALSAAVALRLGGGTKYKPGTVVVEPPSGPLGTAVTVTGTGLVQAARAQPREGVTVFFVRPEGRRLRIAPLSTMVLDRNGDFALQLPPPENLELFPPPSIGDAAPRVIPTSPGDLQVAVGSPAGRVLGANFQVRRPIVGARCRHQLVNKCSVLATVFDGDLWISDPRVPLGPAGRPLGWNAMDPPGDFTLVSTEEATFCNFAGDTARFRRQTRPSTRC